MRRFMAFGLVCLFVLAGAASGQLMGSGRYWISGNGGIPMYTPAVDGNVSDLMANGYHLSWKPSDIFAWGDQYGYSQDSDLESRRIRVYAIDVDNNLYLADGEDPAENGTDADWQGNYYISWDDENLYMAANHVDNHYDVTQAPATADWGFWQRDMTFLAFDLLNIGGVEAERAPLPLVFVHPMNLDEAVFSMQFQATPEVGGTAVQAMYGNDPDFFMGAQLFGGPTDQGYSWEAAIPWDLLFKYQPDARGNVGVGYQFRMRYIVADPDGDDGYGQTYFGGDQTNLGNVSWWPMWTLVSQLGPTAVEQSTWGLVKQLQR
ncbi:MAG: hypothetical protein AB1505_32745 [Candidatus Latescibacterota bacterium]